MIPIENSVAGASPTSIICCRNPACSSSANGFADPSPVDGAARRKLADIKTGRKHVHALGQCRRIIRKLGIKPIVSGDTAGSARIVAERGDNHCAAIASKLAAEIYGLDILAEDVEDETHNTTRFVVLAREANWAESGSGPLVTTLFSGCGTFPPRSTRRWGLRHQRRQHDKLESYMVDGNFFATQFYADVDGHPEDKNLAFALEELKFFSREFRIVRVYPGHPFRATFSEKPE